MSGTTFSKISDIPVKANGDIDRFLITDTYIYGKDTSSPYTYTKWLLSSGDIIGTSNTNVHSSSHCLINVKNNPKGVDYIYGSRQFIFPLSI